MATRVTPGQTYAYESLSNELEQIRVLKLLPQSNSSELFITLHINTLPEAIEERYEALSYAWGSTEDSVLVAVISLVRETPSDARHIPVTRNLWDALQQLRHLERPRTLWVDALCIDQGNYDERSHQVRLMGSIFSGANRVLMWLGPESDDSQLALNAIENISRHGFYDWRKQKWHSKSNEPEWSIDNHPSPYHGGPILDATIGFFARPYWSRLWIRQEIALASDSLATLVMCGRGRIAWDKVRSAVGFFGLKPTVAPIRTVARLLKALYFVSAACAATVPCDSLTGLVCGIGFGCRDDRDRVYALLSVIDSNSSLSSISVDYTRTVEDLFTEVTMTIMEERQSLSIWYHAPIRRGLPHLPSWVCDWTISHIPEGMNIATNAGLAVASLPACRSRRSSNVLHAKGAFITQIGQISGLQCNDNGSVTSSRRATKNALIDLLFPSITEQLQKDCETDLLHRLERLFSGDKVHELLISPLSGREKRLRYRPKFEHAFLKILKEGQDIDPRDHTVKSALAGFEIFRSYRVLVLTEDGRLGHAHHTARIGDRIVIFPGAPSPTLLRPKADGTYTFRGSMYLEGVMHGEALIGPIPPDWEVVYVHDSTNQPTRRDAWRNKKTGEIHDEDPRLSNDLIVRRDHTGAVRYRFDAIEERSLVKSEWIDLV